MNHSLEIGGTESKVGETQVCLSFFSSTFSAWCLLQCAHLSLAVELSSRQIGQKCAYVETLLGLLLDLGGDGASRAAKKLRLYTRYDFV